MVKYELKDMTEALNLGFELIISAAFKGALSEERVRQFWILDLAELSAGKKRSDSEAANVAIDAFTTLTLAGLALFTRSSCRNGFETKRRSRLDSRNPETVSRPFWVKGAGDS